MYKVEQSYKGYKKILQDTNLNIIEKMILLILISFWKTRDKGYLNLSKKFFSRELGVDDHTIKKYYDKLKERGFFQEYTSDKYKNVPSRIVLKQDYINSYFGGDFFKTKEKSKGKQVFQECMNDTGITLEQIVIQQQASNPCTRQLDYIKTLKESKIS